MPQLAKTCAVFLMGYWAARLSLGRPVPTKFHRHFQLANEIAADNPNARGAQRIKEMVDFALKLENAACQRQENPRGRRR
jgi:hypothetical protein